MKNVLIYLLLSLPLITTGQSPERITGPKAKNTIVIKRNQSVTIYNKVKVSVRLTDRYMKKTKHTVRRRRVPLPLSMVAKRTLVSTKKRVRITGPKAKNRRPERPAASH